MKRTPIPNPTGATKAISVPTLPPPPLTRGGYRVDVMNWGRTDGKNCPKGATGSHCCHNSTTCGSIATPISQNRGVVATKRTPIKIGRNASRSGPGVGLRSCGISSVIYRWLSASAYQKATGSCLSLSWLSCLLCPVDSLFQRPLFGAVAMVIPVFLCWFMSYIVLTAVDQFRTVPPDL